MMHSPQPPHSIEAEIAILGGVALDPSAMNVAVQLLKPEDFYAPAHGVIFGAMIDLFRAGAPIDLVTLRTELVDRGNLARAGGDEKVLAVTDFIPSVDNIEHYCQLVSEKAAVRRMVLACQKIASAGYGDYGEAKAYLDAAERQVFEVSRLSNGSAVQRVRPLVVEAFSAAAAADMDSREVAGLSTGIPALDIMTAGFKSGELIIVAGRPGMGKSALALQVAVEAALEAQTTALVFSLEMSKSELTRRAILSEARVSGQSLRAGKMDRDEWMQFTSAAATIADIPLFIDDTPGISVMEIRGKARRVQAEHGLGLVVVDYLQLMSGGSKDRSREQEISEISRSLKALARELEVPVVALSQLNREVESKHRPDKRPQISDLRESGAIEQDADVILFVYRDEQYERGSSANAGRSEVIIGKQRAGPTGTVKTRFSKDFTRFSGLADSGLAE